MTLPRPPERHLRERATPSRRRDDRTRSEPAVVENPDEEGRQLRLYVAPLLVALASALFLVWMACGAFGSVATDRADELGELGSALVATIALAIASRRGGRDVSALRTLTAGAAVWSVGEAIWCYLDIVRGISIPFPSAADPFFLSASALLLVGVSLLYRGELGRIGRLRLVLDGILLASSLLAISYLLVLMGVIRQHPPALSETVALAYPLFDVAIVSVATALLVRRSKGERRRVALIALATLSFGIADCGFVYSSLLSDYNALGNLTDGGWFIGFLLLALAAHYPDPGGEEPTPQRGASWWQLGLPYGVLLIGSSAAAWQFVADGAITTFLATDAAIGVLALLGRQVVALVENARLARRLQDAIDALSAEEVELERLARHDPLTGLANRLAFTEQLAGTLDAKHSVSGLVGVIYCDLDAFKDVNDSLGHFAGDEVLVSVAARLRRCVRPGDSVARLGGDEFAVILEELASRDDAVSVAQRIVETMRVPIAVAGEEFTIRASVGIAIREVDELDTEAMLREADVALYAIKDSGGNDFCLFEPELGRRNFERLRLQSELADAAGRGELVVEYQPVFDLEHRGVRSVEALVRWQHPLRGRLEPHQFLDVAERSGAIVSIGRQVLRDALAHLHHLRSEGSVDDEFEISVNLSARQLDTPGLVELVEEELARAGLRSGLRLELTESALFDGSPQTLQILDRLVGLGVSLAIDDFGTGYSSLSYLKRLPVDALKIDRSFVTACAEDPYDREIVRSVLQLSEALGIEVVAEGIENEAQLETLRALGCRLGQGFLFSPPVSGEALAALLGAAVAPARAGGASRAAMLSKMADEAEDPGT